MQLVIEIHRYHSTLFFFGMIYNKTYASLKYNMIKKHRIVVYENTLSCINKIIYLPKQYTIKYLRACHEINKGERICLHSPMEHVVL